MVRQSELPFRLLVRELGCHLAYTPMLYAEAVVAAPNVTTVFETSPLDRPLIIQLCGNDPVLLAEASRRLSPHCDAIDLNLGCPQRCAERGNFGAYLLEKPDVVEALVISMVNAATVPITCKIRLREKLSDTIELAQR
jgi:tRNA-dihydrouridine synthase 1